MKLFILLLLAQFAPRQKPCLGIQLDYENPLTQALIGEWVMNEGAGTAVYDISGNGNNGTFGGTPTWTAGHHGYAIEYGASDNIQMPHASAYNFEYTDPFSISFWMKITGGSGPLITKQLDSGNYEGWAVQFYDFNNQLRLQLTGAGAANKSIIARYTFSASGDWSGVLLHIVFTYDGSGVAAGVKLYVNGVEKTLTADDDDLGGRSIVTTVPLWINGRGAAQQGNIVGIIDNLSIYNRILTQSEAIQLYQEPFCIFKKDNLAILQLVTQAVPPSGTPQVISIQMSLIPLWLIGFTVLIIKRIKNE